ncbi:hypothetical protein J6590_040609 [Homalodisca vitripennis]|nr:hypothetical protein J6590_040609 [Homalodisca vitripennis]
MPHAQMLDMCEPYSALAGPRKVIRRVLPSRPSTRSFQMDVYRDPRKIVRKTRSEYGPGKELRFNLEFLTQLTFNNPGEIAESVPHGPGLLPLTRVTCTTDTPRHRMLIV